MTAARPPAAGPARENAAPSAPLDANSDSEAARRIDRAVEFLKAVAREKGIEDEVRRLARTAEQKARRRGEEKVARLARDVLE